MNWIVIETYNLIPDSWLLIGFGFVSATSLWRNIQFTRPSERVIVFETYCTLWSCHYMLLTRSPLNLLRDTKLHIPFIMNKPLLLLLPASFAGVVHCSSVFPFQSIVGKLLDSHVASQHLISLDGMLLYQMIARNMKILFVFIWIYEGERGSCIVLMV